MCSKDTKRIVVNLDVQTKNLLALPWCYLTRCVVGSAVISQIREMSVKEAGPRRSDIRAR